jgi:multiple sugar transport system permease protein
MVKRTGKYELVSLYALLAVCLAATLLPFVWMLSTSFKDTSEIFTKSPVFIPKTPTLQNYRELFVRVDFLMHFLNSVIVAAGVTFLSLLVNALAAFAFAKLNFAGREKLFALLLLTMMVPGQVTMMPVFIILKSLGLLNSYLGLIIPGCASIFAIFMLRQFMRDIPDELIDAARIDGCSDFRVFFNIVLPLCKPALVTLLIFNFMGAWNEFLWPLIVMIKEERYTLPVALANLNGQFGTDWGILMAGSVVVVAPVIIVFLIAQKHYIEGITAGAVKG